MKDGKKQVVGIKAWAQDDQPRYKLRSKGAASLSTSELLALLIGSGSTSESAVDLCRRMLKEVDQDLDQLARLTLKELQAFKGIGEAKAISIAAALELGRRRQSQDIRSRPQIINSQRAYEIIAPLLTDKNHEEFWVLLLDRSSKIQHKFCISHGGVAGTVVDPKIIFKKALDHLASGLILVHNHPSGQLKPSKQDLALTQKLKNGADLLDMKVLDHIIIGGRDYLSFADEGLL